MMNADNYKRTITVAASPDAAYQAITSGFSQWWTTPDNTFSKVGDRAKFGFPPGKSYWAFQAVDLSPGERVELECVDAFHLHDGLPAGIEKEWLGTRVIWTIRSIGNDTDIHFEHIGLTPALLCFSVCKNGWDFFFVDSLKAYLDTGEGTPHRWPE